MKQPHIPPALRQRLFDEAGHRCGYCLLPQQLSNIPLEVEHVVPRSAGGTDHPTNLWVACSACNAHKAAKTEAKDPKTGRLAKLFNPRAQAWDEHFRWEDEGARAAGKTACGRATVETLALNDDLAVRARRFWVRAGWFPPASDR